MRTSSSRDSSCPSTHNLFHRQGESRHILQTRRIFVMPRNDLYSNIGLSGGIQIPRSMETKTNSLFKPFPAEKDFFIPPAYTGLNSLTLWTPSNFLPNSCRRRLNFSHTTPRRRLNFRKTSPGADVFSSLKNVATPRELSYLN